MNQFGLLNALVCMNWMCGLVWFGIALHWYDSHRIQHTERISIFKCDARQWTSTELYITVDESPHRTKWLSAYISPSNLLHSESLSIVCVFFCLFVMSLSLLPSSSSLFSLPVALPNKQWIFGVVWLVGIRYYMVLLQINLPPNGMEHSMA